MRDRAASSGSGRRDGGWWRALGAVLLVASAAVGALAGTRSAEAAELFGYDTIVPPGAQVDVFFRLQAGLFVRVPLPGATVEFSLNGQPLGTARTGLDGRAVLAVQLPAQPGDYLVQGAVRGGPWSAPPATALVAVRAQQGGRLVVVDLAHTIADGSFAELLLRPPGAVPPVRGAPAALSDLDHDALVVYLVGHDEVFAPEVRRWLAHWGFPRGLTIFGKEWVMMLQGAAYKRAVYQLLASGWQVAAGFGDGADDAQAAGAAQVPFIAIGTGVGGLPAYPDWEAVRAANRAGALPALAWASRLR
ncbi:MAG: hypothetical protein KatS3mg102_2099 [Planctomycetota bacterium]|nr:MAG: hypothetical protein KatS3mg102_2099 [Planctomycetota bacterium]